MALPRREPARRCSMASRRGATRIERDSMGEIEVPAGALYGPQTQRAVENFPVSGRGLPARVHPRAGADQGRCGAGQPRARAARRRRSRGRSSRPPARSPRERSTPSSRSTSSRPARAPRTNMNANEVIAQPADRGSRRPGAARGRSTPTTTSTSASPRNDVIPTALHVAAVLAIERDLLPALRAAARRLAPRRGEFDGRHQDRRART